MHYAHYSKSKRPCKLCGAGVFVSPRRANPDWRPETCPRDDVIGQALNAAFSTLIGKEVKGKK